MTDQALQVEPCVDQLAVLSNKARLGVLMELLERPKSVTELNGALRISQSLLSHHLKVLRVSGFVTSERRGKEVHYKVSPALMRTQRRLTVDLGCCRLSFQRKPGPK